MKRFEFRLASALKWRGLQLRQEQDKLSHLTNAEQRARAALEHFCRERESAREALRRGATIDGTEMRALSAYLLGCEPRERMLVQRLNTAIRAAADQRKKTI